MPAMTIAIQWFSFTLISIQKKLLVMKLNLLLLLLKSMLFTGIEVQSYKFLIFSKNGYPIVCDLFTIYDHNVEPDENGRFFLTRMDFSMIFLIFIAWDSFVGGRVYMGVYTEASTHKTFTVSVKQSKTWKNCFSDHFRYFCIPRSKQNNCWGIQRFCSCTKHVIDGYCLLPLLCYVKCSNINIID